MGFIQDAMSIFGPNFVYGVDLSQGESQSVSVEQAPWYLRFSTERLERIRKTAFIKEGWKSQAEDVEYEAV